MNPIIPKVKRIKFFTLGCKANQYDTQSIRERFLSQGFCEAEPGQLSDYFLVNTCTVTSGADLKSRNLIRRCIQSNPGACVIVTGCLAEKDWQILAKIKGISLIIKKSFFPEGISSFSQHIRAFLKIQDGCSNFCTYCKVALVRGKPRSKKLKQVVKEAQELVACGYQEIVLTGICLGAYGQDFDKQEDLADVVNALDEIKGLARIRLSSIEAGDVSPRLIKCLQTSKKLCRHLHIPIQSGSDKILKQMNRKYSRQQYQDLILKIKTSIPDLAITTDCLVGFPGETEQDFQDTVDLVETILPLKVHIFPYSSRPGTKAADFKGLVNSSVINFRCAELEKVSVACQEKLMQTFVDQKVKVLIAGNVKGRPDLLEGLTDNYLKVIIPFQPGLKNKMVQVRLKQIVDNCLRGEYIDNF